VPLFSLLAQQLAHGVQVNRQHSMMRPIDWGSEDDAEDD